MMIWGIVVEGVTIVIDKTKKVYKFYFDWGENSQEEYICRDHI